MNIEITSSRAAVVVVLLGLVGCGGPSVTGAPGTNVFSNPERVTIQGYDGHAMEPFITRDGHYLLFNNLNHPSENTDLHYAERVDDVTFRYVGRIDGVNTPALEGVATMDRDNLFYFVSTRSYDQSSSTIYRGTFSTGRVAGVELVPGVSRVQPGMVNFDVDVSPDGNTMYFVDSRFANGAPETADIVIAERRGTGFERMSRSDEIMRNVNSSDLEYAACISADGLTLFFTRLHKGLTGDAVIFIARRSSSTAAFDQPLRLSAIDGFVEGPALSPDERSLYYHRRDGDRFVIYRVTKR
jgi:Tol biopolymer transport system component